MQSSGTSNTDTSTGAIDKRSLQPGRPTEAPLGTLRRMSSKLTSSSMAAEAAHGEAAPAGPSPRLAAACLLASLFL